MVLPVLDLAARQRLHWARGARVLAGDAGVEEGGLPVAQEYAPVAGLMELREAVATAASVRM